MLLANRALSVSPVTDSLTSGQQPVTGAAEPFRGTASGQIPDRVWRWAGRLARVRYGAYYEARSRMSSSHRKTSTAVLTCPRASSFERRILLFVDEPVAALNEFVETLVEGFVVAQRHAGEDLQGSVEQRQQGE
jgi:hypothetical protein